MQPISYRNYATLLVTAVMASSSLSYSYIIPGRPGAGPVDSSPGVEVGGVRPMPPGGAEPGRPERPERPGNRPVTPGGHHEHEPNPPLYPGPIGGGHNYPPGPIYNPGPGPIGGGHHHNNPPGPIYPNPQPYNPYDPYCSPSNPYYPYCNGSPNYPDPYPHYPEPYPNYPEPNPYPVPAPNDLTKVVYVNRWVSSETLELSRLSGLDYINTQDLELESVAVDLRGTGSSAHLIQLVVNGVSEDVEYSPSGYVILRPNSSNCDPRRIQLYVNGSLFIDTVTINLRRQYDSGYGIIRVPLSVYQRLYAGSRLNLNNYFNESLYRGYRVQAVEVTADADYSSSLLQLIINGFVSATANVGSYSQTVTMYPRNVNPVIGYGADSLILTAQSDVTIQSVTLRLYRQ